MPELVDPRHVGPDATVSGFSSLPTRHHSVRPSRNVCNSFTPSRCCHSRGHRLPALILSRARHSQPPDSSSYCSRLFPSATFPESMINFTSMLSASIPTHQNAANVLGLVHSWTLWPVPTCSLIPCPCCPLEVRELHSGVRFVDCTSPYPSVWSCHHGHLARSPCVRTCVDVFELVKLQVLVSGAFLRFLHHGQFLRASGVNSTP